jgi:integrase
MKLTLFARTEHGKKTWYYYYYDVNGKRIKRTTGCSRKSDAQAIIDALTERIQREANSPRGISFGEYTKGFFDSKSQILTRWESHGKVDKDKTLQSHKHYLVEYLTPWFGAFQLTDITAKALDARLLQVKRSGSWKNCVKDTLTLIMKEALYDGLITTLPTFRSYARNSRRQDILTDAELKALFPFGMDELRRIWKAPSDSEQNTGFMFAVIAALAVSAGLRSGEVRAIHREQLIGGKGLIVDRAYDDREKEIGYLKKGSATDPRYRVVPLSDYTLELLDNWLDVRGDGPGPIFLYHGELVSAKYLLTRFEMAKKAAGIPTTGRHTTIHGLRYTYNTKMKMAMPREVLHEIVGHRSDDMTNLYDRPVLEKRLDDFRAQVLPAVNGFWK